MPGATQTDALALEQHILDHYVMYYNMNRRADTIRGYIHPPEMREYIRAIQGSPVHVYKNGNLLQSFASFAEFCEGSYAGRSVFINNLDTETL